MKFLDYLVRNKIDNKLYILGFFIAIVSYSLWQPIEGALDFSEQNQGKIFFIGMAFSFCCYTSAYMFSKWDKWRWFPMFVFFICLSRLLKEVYYVYNPSISPEEYNIFDYVDFLITIFIIFNYYIKFKHKRYKDNETNKKL